VTTLGWPTGSPRSRQTSSQVGRDLVRDPLPEERTVEHDSVFVADQQSATDEGLYGLVHGGRPRQPVLVSDVCRVELRYPQGNDAHHVLLLRREVVPNAAQKRRLVADHLVQAGLDVRHNDLTLGRKSPEVELSS